MIIWMLKHCHTYESSKQSIFSDWGEIKSFVELFFYGFFGEEPRLGSSSSLKTKNPETWVSGGIFVFSLFKLVNCQFLTVKLNWRGVHCQFLIKLFLAEDVFPYSIIILIIINFIEGCHENRFHVARWMRLGPRVHLVDMNLGGCAPWTKSPLGGHEPRRTRTLDQEHHLVDVILGGCASRTKSTCGSSESPILGGSGAVESEQGRDSECSISFLFPRVSLGGTTSKIIIGDNSSLIGLQSTTEEFSIPPEVGLRIPNERERATDPELGSAAFHPSFMELGVKLPLQPYLRRFLRDIGLAPAQISPNVLGIEIDPSFAEIQHCYKLAPHTRGGDAVWERVHENQLTPDERRHVAAAWKTHSRERYINQLLGDWLLSSFGFIPVPTALRALMETSAIDRPEEGVAEDVRPLKVRPPRFKEVSSKAGGGLGGDQSPSEERVGGNSFRGPPPMYSQGRTPTGQVGFGGPFSLEDSVDFMCSYARNFMRSGDSGGAGKISNDDRKMESELIIKKDTCSSLKARLAHSEALAAEGVKATEYRERLRKSRALVKRLRRELLDRAIDRWIRSSEYTKAIDEEFERGATDTKYLISRVDSNFDFEKLKEIRAEEWTKGGATEEVGEPIVEEDSLDLEDVMLTDPEVESASD
ncbi:hypothetical protein ACOSQ2_024468 [Xanthoceras sorbifolium]